jgi:hypothetical protein
MNERKAHQVWTEQCEAAETIKERFGLKAAFDYLVGEKLLSFADAAGTHPDFARELPQFVSEVRRMFTPEERRAHLARVEREQHKRDAEAAEEDDPLAEGPAAAAERAQRFSLIKELLTATALGTS